MGMFHNQAGCQNTLNSKPTFTGFDPAIIPYQIKVLKDWTENYDYSIGAHEILLSGSVGSAKSILMAHMAVWHCLAFPRARICLGRKAMPDLKSTIYAKILEHLDDMEEGKDFYCNHTNASIKFIKNGSEIISRSWSDKRYKKGRSLELSGLIIEELTENDLDDKEAYDELRMRVGRIPGIKQNFVVCATNPDSPSHWAYDYFINSTKKTRHVYYSSTSDNPFLPDWYINQLKEDLDPKMARRMIYGEWIEITKEIIYHSYTKERNFRDEVYKIVPHIDIDISFDFNIGEGKPLSCCLAQYIKDHFHFYAEAKIEGASTEDVLFELRDRGLLDEPTRYRIFGDATGRSRDTRSKGSDYDIIRRFLSNYQGPHGPVDFEMCVARSNPPIRTRHNKVNAYCKNSFGNHRLTIYKDCPTLDKGFRLTSLKKGGQYIEDDSKEFQHITTAAGYYIVKAAKDNNKPKVMGYQYR